MTEQPKANLCKLHSWALREVDKLNKNCMGFYTLPPFWAGESINRGNSSSLEQWTALSSAIAFQYDLPNSRIKVSSDGLLMLSLKEFEETVPNPDGYEPESVINWWSKYIEYLNCLNLIFDSTAYELMKATIFHVFEITRKDIIRIVVNEDQTVQYFSVDGRASLQVALSRHGKSSDEVLDLQLEELARQRIQVDKVVFDKVAERFQLALSIEGIVPRLAALAKSLSEFKVGNYQVSLVLAWFVIESLLIRRWKIMLDSKNRNMPNGESRINSDRKKNLIDGRDYSASVITNIMELCDNLPYELYRRVDTARVKRNAVVHTKHNSEIIPKDCVNAIEVALELLFEETGLYLQCNFAYLIPSV